MNKVIIISSLAKQVLENVYPKYKYLARDQDDFDGLQAYAGHISHIEDISTRKQMTADNYNKLKELIIYFSKGLEFLAVNVIITLYVNKI